MWYKRITYLLTSRSTALLEKLTGFQLVKKFSPFYGTRRLITAFKSARHLSLPWVSSIHSITPHPTSWISILILSSHLRLCGLFPSGFPTKTLYTPLLGDRGGTVVKVLCYKSEGRWFDSPIRATCPAHLILLDFITRKILGEQYRSFSFSLCSFLHSRVMSSLLGPNIINTLFSNTLSLRSSLNPYPANVENRVNS